MATAKHDLPSIYQQILGQGTTLFIMSCSLSKWTWNISLDIYSGKRDNELKPYEQCLVKINQSHSTTHYKKKTTSYYLQQYPNACSNSWFDDSFAANPSCFETLQRRIWGGLMPGSLNTILIKNIAIGQHTKNTVIRHNYCWFCVTYTCIQSLDALIVGFVFKVGSN